MFALKSSLQAQMDPEFLSRFLNFWVILGFAFFIAIWVIQAIHIGLLKKDVVELESKVMELKSKLYDFNSPSKSVRREFKVVDTPEKDPDSSSSRD